LFMQQDVGIFITVIIIIIIIIIVVIVSVKGEPLRRSDAHLPRRIRAAAARVHTAAAACIRATAAGDTSGDSVRPAVTIPRMYERKGSCILSSSH